MTSEQPSGYNVNNLLFHFISPNCSRSKLNFFPIILHIKETFVANYFILKSNYARLWKCMCMCAHMYL